MNDDQLLRYSRQIMLPQVDYAGQQRLLNASVLIIGLGGLGAPVALYLAAAGVGRLLLSDFDRVELTNLQRQVIHATADIGKRKVDSARETLLAINPDIEVVPLPHRLEGEALQQAVAGVDLVIDATDNFASRFATNRACVATHTPLVTGAAIRMEGQVTLFSNRTEGDQPCYRCLYQEEGELSESCSDNGVLAPVVGIIGTIQATEALKLLLEIGVSLEGRLLLLDAVTMEWRSLRFGRDPECPVCASPQPDTTESGR